MSSSSIAKAERKMEKLKERERERDRKLNIEALIEEEKKEKSASATTAAFPKLDMMPNKAGSTYQRNRCEYFPLFREIIDW